MVFVRQAWMRTFRMQHLEQAVDVVLPISRPFVAIEGEETDFGQQGAPVLGYGPTGRLLLPHIPGDVVEQALKEGAPLPVGGRPVAASTAVFVSLILGIPNLR